MKSLRPKEVSLALKHYASHLITKDCELSFFSPNIPLSWKSKYENLGDLNWEQEVPEQTGRAWGSWLKVTHQDHTGLSILLVLAHLKLRFLLHSHPPVFTVQTWGTYVLSF